MQHATHKCPQRQGQGAGGARGGERSCTINRQRLSRCSHHPTKRNGQKKMEKQVRMNIVFAQFSAWRSAAEPPCPPADTTTTLAPAGCAILVAITGCTAITGCCTAITGWAMPWAMTCEEGEGEEIGCDERKEPGWEVVSVELPA